MQCLKIFVSNPNVTKSYYQIALTMFKVTWKRIFNFANISLEEAKPHCLNGFLYFEGNVSSKLAHVT